MGVIRFIVIQILIAILFGVTSFAGDTLAFRNRCRDIFKDFMGDFPGEYVSWKTEISVKDGSMKPIRRYENVHLWRFNREDSVLNLLPSVVAETLGQDMQFNFVAAVMNFYFPGFGLSMMNPNSNAFLELLGTSFYSTKGRESARPGDMVIIRIENRIKHAMIYIGNGVVWQKLSMDAPAGFFNFWDTFVALTEGLSKSQYNIEYYRPRFDLSAAPDFLYR